MEDTLVGSKVAKLAKEEGFDIECSYWYDMPSLGGILIEKNSIYDKSAQQSYKKESAIYAPTQSLLQKWLREKHNLFVQVTDSNGVLDQQHFRWAVSALHSKNYLKTSQTAFNFENTKNGTYKTFEEAFEDALYYALEIIKTI